MKRVDPDTTQAGPQVSTCSAPQPGGSVGAGGGGPLDSPPLLGLAPRETLTEFSPDEMTTPPSMGAGFSPSRGPDS